MTKENMILIGAVVLIVVLAIVIRGVLNTVAHKGMDAIHNARIRAQEEKNPPKAESLAERYNKLADDSEKKQK